MKVNSNRDISFKGFYNNNLLRRGLEVAADKGALFAAGTTLGLSYIARPVSVWLTPNIDEQTKKAVLAKSLTTTSVGYLIMLALSNPMANSIHKIDENPQKYLKSGTIANFQNTKSDSYKFATQIFKLGLGLLTAIPKALISSATLPYVLKTLPECNKNGKENHNISFKANLPEENIAKNIGNIMNKKNFQKFTNKYKDTNFVMHITALTDMLSTTTFATQTYKSKKINDNDKKTLIYNSGISTILSICCGYIADKLLDKPTEKFIQKYKLINKNEKNLEKQLEGIKIAKPILLLGGIYYILIPLLSTFLADKADKNPKLDLHTKKQNNLF